MKFRLAREDSRSYRNDSRRRESLRVSKGSRPITLIRCYPEKEPSLLATHDVKRQLMLVVAISETRDHVLSVKVIITYVRSTLI
jgi:hypothetical protein